MLFLALASPAFASKITINELYRSGSLGSTGDEWVELVILEDLSAAELDGYSVGDSTSTTAAKFSGYRFTGMADFADTFPAGTILVVTGGAGAPADGSFDPDTGDYSLVLATTDPHVVSNGSSGDFAGTDVAYVDLDGTNGDATLSADGFLVNWDSSPGVFGALGVLVAVPTSGTGLVLIEGPQVADDPASWSVSVALDALTPGEPNGGANTVEIEALRGCADADDDTVCDDIDLCPFDADPSNSDTDADGIGDVCDDCLDVDADTVCDDLDLCPTIPDPTNDDLDGDGIGDACDDCVGPDADEDTVCDALDLCPLDSDPSNDDTDGDGIGDVCDLPLILDVGPLIPGQTLIVSVSDAQPGELVVLVTGLGPVDVGPCPPALAGLCLDIGTVDRRRSAVADDTGYAEFSLELKPSLVGTFTFQAVVTRGAVGEFSLKSDPVERTVP